jgi:hypothetical protein
MIDVEEQGSGSEPELKKCTFYIRNLADLDKLLIEHQKLSRKDRICLIPRPVAGSELNKMEEAVNRHLNACGCESGAGGLLFAGSLCILWLSFRPQGVWPLSFYDFAITAVVVIAGLAIGKKIGLFLVQTTTNKDIVENPGNSHQE